MAAVEFAQGLSGPCLKKRMKGIQRDNFYNRYLDATVQCAWKCALASLDCQPRDGANLPRCVGMCVVMVMKYSDQVDLKVCSFGILCI